MTETKTWAGVIIVLALAVGIFFAGRWTMHREDLLSMAPPPHVPAPTHAKPDTIYPKPIILYKAVADTNARHRADSLLTVIESMHLDSSGYLQRIKQLATPWVQVDSVEHPWIWGRIETAVEPVLRHAFPVFYLDSVYTPPPVITAEEYIAWPWLFVCLLAGLLTGVLL